MKKNKCDLRCGGSGNCRVGSLDDPPTDDRESKEKVRLATNRRALKKNPDLVIRLGLPAEEE